MSEPSFPLADLARPGALGAGGAPQVTLAERRPGSIVQIGAWPETVDVVAAAIEAGLGIRVDERPGRAVSTAGVVVMTLAPGRWLLVSSEAALPTRLAHLPADRATLVDLSEARGGVRIAGPACLAVLRKGVALDLDARAFPPGSATQTTVHHMGVLIHRLGPEIFDLFVFRGFAVSFWEWLVDAAAEFGVRVVEPVA